MVLTSPKLRLSRFQSDSDDTKNKQFCGNVGHNPFFFFFDFEIPVIQISG